MKFSFLTDKENKILEYLEIKSVEEIFYLFPKRYNAPGKAKLIKDIAQGENVSISGIVIDIDQKTGYHNKGLKYTKAVVLDETDDIEVFWWNMPYVANQLKIDQKIILTGIVENKNGKLILNNPRIEKVKTLTINNENTLFQKDENKILETEYTSGKFFKGFQIKNIVEKTFRTQKTLELIPEKILKEVSLPSRIDALKMMHFPKKDTDIQVAKKYLAFEEIFVMQVYREFERRLRKDFVSYDILQDKKVEKELLEILPFKLTKGQNKVMSEILDDMKSEKPMSRLVEGDVGSGKTILALIATFYTVHNKYKNAKSLQVAYIAPTEILANQHFKNFIEILKDYKHLGIALLTSKGAKIWPAKIKGKNGEEWIETPKTRIKKLLQDGKINIVIGTHALFAKTVSFEYLGLIIIDEQHRFGVKQRMSLLEKTKQDSENFSPAKKPIPHLLSMSATPIPRTLALTIYGDLDLSVLGELPPGRKRAKTILTNKYKREETYEKLGEFLENKKQAYIICPRIYDEEESEQSLTNKKTSVEFEYKRIKEKFKKYKIEIVHGKQNKKEQQEIIRRFYDKDIDILISTSVVEVGISVPNATFMIIENSEHFGLAQLHQLRGRVERSSDESICFLATDSESETSLKRLEALTKTNNGFELAEIDLAERGAGSLIGKKQSGLTDIGMEAIKNRKLVEIAKEKAKQLLEDDENLNNFENKNLKNKIDSFAFHEE